MNFSNANVFNQIELNLLKKDIIDLQKPRQHNSAQFNDMASAILHSLNPIKIDETQEVTYGGERGIWANREEVLSWRGERPISEYPLNYDMNPEVIKKKSTHLLKYVQGIYPERLII